MYCVNDLSVFTTPPSATDVLCERSVSIHYPLLGYWCIVWTICQYSLPFPRLLMYCVNDMSVFTTPPSATDVLCERSVSIHYPSLGYWCIVWTICQYSLPLPRLLMYCVNDLSVFATLPSATDVLCERYVSVHYPSLGYWCNVWTICQYSLPLPRLLMYCVNDLSVFTTLPLGYWCIVWTICQYSLPLPRLLMYCVNDMSVFATLPSATDVLCERFVSIHYPSLGYWCIVWTICQYSLPLPRLLSYHIDTSATFSLYGTQ